MNCGVLSFVEPVSLNQAPIGCSAVEELVASATLPAGLGP